MVAAAETEGFGLRKSTPNAGGFLFCAEKYSKSLRTVDKNLKFVTENKKQVDLQTAKTEI